MKIKRRFSSFHYGVIHYDGSDFDYISLSILEERWSVIPFHIQKRNPMLKGVYESCDVGQILGMIHPVFAQLEFMTEFESHINPHDPEITQLVEQAKEEIKEEMHQMIQERLREIQ